MTTRSAFSPLAALLFATTLLPAQAPATPAPQSTPPAAAPASADQFPDSPSASAQVKPEPVPAGPTAVFDTTMGRLTCKLFSKEAPLATANFVTLAEGKKDFTDPVTGQKVHSVHFYDGTTFHRVIPGFMIQGGDRRGDGTGDAGYYFENESLPNLTFSVPGRLAMANAGPNTNGTQFFITEVAQPELDGKYTIFGQCDAHSVLIAATIARVDRNSADKPLAPVTINKLTIVPEGQPMPPLPPQPAAPAAPAAPPSQL